MKYALLGLLLLAATADAQLIIKGTNSTGLTTYFTKPASGGLLDFRCGTGLTCSYANNVFTLTAPGSAGGGESNTASNVGAGVGLFKQKSLLDLQFKSIRSTTSALTVAANADGVNVDLTIVPSNLTLLSGQVTTALGFTPEQPLTFSSPFSRSTNTIGFGSQTANFVLVAPDNTGGVPVFRALIANDIPSLPTTGITGLVTGGLITPSLLPLPTSSNLGGVKAVDCQTTGKISAGIGTDGLPICVTAPAGGGGSVAGGFGTIVTLSGGVSTVDLNDTVAATQAGPNVYTNTNNFSGATQTAFVRTGSADPALCASAIREWFFNTSTNVLKVCVTDNVWTAYGNGGAAPAGADGNLQKKSGTGFAAAVAGTDYAAGTHAAQHKAGGSDPVSQTTTGVNVIPQTGSNSKLATGFFTGGTLQQNRQVTADSNGYPVASGSESASPWVYVTGQVGTTASPVTIMSKTYAANYFATGGHLRCDAFDKKNVGVDPTPSGTVVLKWFLNGTSMGVMTANGASESLFGTMDVYFPASSLQIVNVNAARPNTFSSTAVSSTPGGQNGTITTLDTTAAITVALQSYISGAAGDDNTDVFARCRYTAGE